MARAKKQVGVAELVKIETPLLKDDLKFLSQDLYYALASFKATATTKGAGYPVVGDWEKRVERLDRLALLLQKLAPSAYKVDLEDKDLMLYQQELEKKVAKQKADNEEKLKKAKVEAEKAMAELKKKMEEGGIGGVDDANAPISLYSMLVWFQNNKEKFQAGTYCTCSGCVPYQYNVDLVQQGKPYSSTKIQKIYSGNIPFFKQIQDSWVDIPSTDPYDGDDD